MKVRIIQQHNVAKVVIVFLLVFAACVFAHKKFVKNKNTSHSKEQVQKNTISQSPVIQSKYDNLSLGVPGPADTIIDRPGYALGYIEKHEQPAWVIYRMTADEATTKAAKRGNDFRPDPKIPTGSATLADYRRSGYDRGHLAPAADMAFSGQTMSDSFYMSNMSVLPGFGENQSFTFESIKQIVFQARV